MVTVGRIGRVAISDEVLFGLGAFLAGFVITCASGLIGASNEGFMNNLSRLPVLVIDAVLLVVVLIRIVLVIIRNTAASRSTVLTFHAGLFLITAGIMVSGLTRFEGTVVLAEGQAVGQEWVSNSAGSIHASRYASRPSMGVSLMHVIPSFYPGGMSLWNVRALMAYRGGSSREEKAITCNLLFPSQVDGIFLRVRSFGYAPRYQITDPSGNVLDEAYVFLNLFPPGSEDSFNVMAMPHTFYVRYYPDSALTRDPLAPTAGRQNPVYRLRVARNLDLVMQSRYLTMNERTVIDQESVAFIDMRKWVEIEIIDDKGLYLFLPGILILLAASSWARYNRINVGAA